MEIRSIDIRNFGIIESFKAKPGKGISVVKDRCAKDAMIALAGALSYPTGEAGDFDALQKPGFYINLQVENISECDKLNNINRISGCKEALKCRIFLNDDKQNYNKRLLIYKKCDDYYDRDAFDKETDRLGHMKIFRSVLCNFIRDFKPVTLSNDKDLYVEILQSGEFIVKNRRTNRDQTKMLSGHEQTLFQYVCFLEVNKFWDEIAEIRELNPPKMPLLATNFIEFLDEDQSRSKDVIAYAKALKSQLIIFTDESSAPSRVQ